MKKYWEQLNLTADNDFKVSDNQFKLLISSSLPPSWDTFTEAYVGGRRDIPETDPKKLMSSQQFIGIIKEEAIRRDARRAESSQAQAHQSISLTEPGTGKAKYCNICKLKNHNTSECRNRDKEPCGICKKYHGGKKCWYRDREAPQKGPGKRKRGGKQKGGDAKRQKNETTNEADDEDSNQVVSFIAEEDHDMNCSDNGQSNTTTHVNNMSGNEKPLYFYDWLADSATTSHICNQKEAFVSYKPVTGKTVAGVSNNKAIIEGRGTIELESIYKNDKYLLRLENVLYIPSNRNNLISLGRWDDAGGRYTGGGGGIIFITKDGKHVVKGTKIDNNLYKMKVSIRKPGATISKLTTCTPQTFQATEPTQSWEIWHRRYGHVGYSGLQKLHDLNMVDGFTVDTRTSKPDCIACTEAKQTEEPFNKMSNRVTKPGELTHIDVWGKYSVKSIHGNQYYTIFVDDAGRFTSVKFMKLKTEAVQQVKNYLTHLKTQDKSPKAIRFDNGKEFLNEELASWCAQQGIEIQTTAPYSPSQNGVAERMNRTIVELARAMLNEHQLPQFLWEHAVAHAVYVCNRAFTKALGNKTPYETWFEKRPNVSHFREFGAPVWILLQGQKEAPKMLPKSHRHAYVGFDDGSNSVLYYSAKTHKILKSRNFRFLTLQNNITPPEEIEVAPDLPREGEEPEGSTRLSGDLISPGTGDKRKREEDDNDQFEPRKTRGNRPNYRHLDNPYSDEDDDIFTSDEQFANSAIIPGDELHSLAEARRSPDWPEWEKAAKSEYNQLLDMGTWKLVDKPLDAIPIANKWTFVKKRNKAGEIVKYKARLVAKGCAQRPGYDYVETFSPVVRMETIRAILALIPIEKLKIQQMDIKGVYLNGILQEKVYMRQPEGFEDGTDRVCVLVKTLYGLKQSGREWNKEFDNKIRAFGFQRLKSDPCVYIRRDADGISIITVWVDDILLFASSDKLMQRMKDDIHSQWEATDMGDPAKIVGIEITQTGDSIMITQQKYIESILQREHMEEANPVSTPLDPNIKIGPNPEGNNGNRSNCFAQLLGELQFLANATRPDIAHTINRLAAYTANPSLQHMGALKRVLRYLAGTKGYGIVYKNTDTPNSPNIFHGYADAAFANQDDCKSTSGYVFIAGGGAITWRSKKQTTVALSSTEAEYIALAEAAREASWLRNLYDELGYSQIKPTLIRGDNNGAIAMARNPQFHQRSKHIAIRWHLIRDMVSDGILTIDECRDPEQTADVLTKTLARFKHHKHIIDMGMAST